jgi:hypothetical protein
MYILTSKERKGVYLIMQHMTGIPAISYFFSSLKPFTEPRSFYRCFCRSISITTIGFSVQTIKGEGRPS